MSMNEMLDQFYGTTKTASARSNGVAETEKAAEAAEVQLFLKLAGEENIDIDSMLKTEEGRAQVDALWGQFQKQAAAAREFEEKRAGDKDDKDPRVEAAEKEHKDQKEKAAEEAKVAEDIRRADFCGRTMAHAYVQELRKIAAGEPTPEAAAAAEKLAEFPPKKDDDKKDEKKDDDKGGNPFGANKAPPFGKKDDKDEKKEASLGATLHAALAKVAQAKQPPAAQVKKASAIDMLAAERAILKVAEWAGAEEAKNAAEKIHALDVLGQIKESAKVAHAQDLDTAVDWRACELLEQVGYPIDWPQ